MGFKNKRDVLNYINNKDNWKVVDFTQYVCVKKLKHTPIYRIYAHDLKQNEVYLGMFMSENGLLMQDRALTEKELVSYLLNMEDERL